MIASSLHFEPESTGLISPWVRLAKIQRNTNLSGTWTDYDHELTYVHSGYLECALAGDRFVLGPGDCILMPPYMTHFKQAKPGVAVVQYIIHFDFAHEPGRASMINPGLDGNEPWQTMPRDLELISAPVRWQNLATDEIKSLESALVGLMDEFAAKREGRDLALRGRLLLLLVELQRIRKPVSHGAGAYGKFGQEGKSARGRSWASFERAIAWIRRNWQNPDLDNGSIAEAVELSPNYLSEVFRSHTGKGLHEWLLLYRLDKARGLLEEGSMNVGEIAEYCGFLGIHGFSRVFSQKLGMSPLRYRNLHKPGVMYQE